MTVAQLKDALKLNPVTLPEPDREICGAYCGDLLSWVMGRAQADSVWITIMSNINVVAVASLADVACVVLAENAALTEDIIKTAESKGINILSSAQPVYETAVAVSALI